MKLNLNLVLLVLLQQALCALQVVDPAELQSAPHSQHLDVWIESIAAQKNLSKDVVRSNVQAITYHLEPVSKDAGSAGGEHATLERRAILPYLQVFKLERRNDPLTLNRLQEQHHACRSAYLNPIGSPHSARDGLSFWRAFGGNCRRSGVRVYCKLPKEYGPPNWLQHNKSNIHETSFHCNADEECTTFSAFNFYKRDASSWGGCTSRRKTDKVEVVNLLQQYFETYGCPMSPGTTREWDIYGVSDDGKDIDWTAFTGFGMNPYSVSRSPTFLFGKLVKWKGKDPNARPKLRFSRIGEPATIRLYAHLL